MSAFSERFKTWRQQGQDLGRSLVKNIGGPSPKEFVAQQKAKQGELAQQGPAPSVGGVAAVPPQPAAPPPAVAPQPTLVSASPVLVQPAATPPQQSPAIVPAPAIVTPATQQQTYVATPSAVETVAPVIAPIPTPVAAPVVTTQPSQPPTVTPVTVAAAPPAQIPPQEKPASVLSQQPQIKTEGSTGSLFSVLKQAIATPTKIIQQVQSSSQLPAPTQPQAAPQPEQIVPEPVRPVVQQPTASAPLELDNIKPVPLGASTEDEVADHEEEYSDEEDEDEEEEDVEPRLSYHRLGGIVPEILQRDAATCMTVHDKFICIGTALGDVFTLALDGNLHKRFTGTHSTAVNDLSIDATGEYLASCSDEGKVAVHGLLVDEVFEYTHNRPVKAVALDPAFNKKNLTKQFCFGGKAGQLVLSSKNWFRAKDTVIHQGEGPIHAIKWRGSLIAWANDQSINVYDLTAGQRIGFVRRSKSFRPDMYKCHLCWENDRTLIVAWGKMFRILRIKEREQMTVSGGPAGAGGAVAQVDLSMPSLAVEITHSLDFNFIVCGIVPFGENLVMLTHPEDSPVGAQTGEDGEPVCPELRIWTRKKQEITRDTIPIKNVEKCRAIDFRLDYSPFEYTFYITSPRDIVYAKPRDLDDHIRWLMERARYEEALDAAEKNEGQLHAFKVAQIGEETLVHLFKQGDFEKAAQLCPKILRRDPALWDKWIPAFRDRKQLKAISRAIPVGSNCLLKPESYEMVLNSFLQDDPASFHETIVAWSPKTYDVRALIGKVEEEIRRTNNKQLQECLAILFSYEGQFDRALEVYLRIKQGKVFELIQTRNLFASVADKVVLLLEFDEIEGTKLLVANSDKIDFRRVVKQLENYNKRLLHLYLKTLFDKDSNIAADYHGMQIELYAEYDPSQLLTFLKTSSHYSLEDALAVCKKWERWPEMVFILWRMGNNRAALSLTLEKMQDIKEAINFVQEKGQNDEELWEELISYSMKVPTFIAELLDNVGTHVDPIKLIKRIPDGMDIPALRDHLVTIISGCNLEMSLMVSCKAVLVKDCIELWNALVTNQRRGIKVEDFMRCSICEGPVLYQHMRSAEEVIVFFCNHVYHHKCLRPSAAQAGASSSSAATSPEPGAGLPEKLWCPICKSAQKPVGSSASSKSMGPPKKLNPASSKQT